MSETYYEDAIKMAEHLIRQSVTRATGEAERVCLYDRPRHRYFVGALATGADISQSGHEFISRLSPSAMGLDVQVEELGEVPVLLVQPRLSVYYRIFPTLEQQRAQSGAVGTDEEADAVDDGGDNDEDTPTPAASALAAPHKAERPNVQELAQVFRRVDVELPPIRVTLTPGAAGRYEAIGRSETEGLFARAFAGVRAQMAADPDLYRGPSADDRKPAIRVPHTALENHETFHNFLRSQPPCPDIPQWKAALSVEARPIGNGRQRVAIRLQNAAEEDRRCPNTDHFLFNCRLEVRAEKARFQPFTFHSLPRDYRYDRRLWGYGQNCTVELPEGESDADTRRLTTTTAPIYRQEQYVTKDRVEAAFADLAADPIPVLRKIEHEMVRYESEWQVHITAIEKAGTEDAETLTARRQDLQGFRNEIDRFREGIRALEQFPILLHSFRLMNRVFADSGSRKGYTAWRLFQIVFIVMLIPDVACREPACQKEYPLTRLEQVDVLWFPTGGGKTESYLGITVFAAFFDRLRGKKAGVTAWTRFPLRLLSLQQLQRIADVVAAAEIVRRSIPEMQESDPFSVGYLVGEGNTPNNLKTYKHDYMPEFKANPDAMQKYRIISRCPFCGAKSVRMELDEARIRLNHVCTNKDCPETVLPIYVVDNEVYRYLPTIIVGTIDKLSAVGNQRKFSQLFGEVTHLCPLHGYGSVGECTQKYGCPKGTQFQPVSLYDPAPTLQIQDELHLLRESLGTFNGHYETWVDAFQLVRDGTRQKIVAATATIENYEHQIRHLYLRSRPRRFPLPGRELGESFYAETKHHIYRRIFVGIMPHNKTHINSVIELLLYFHEEVQRLRSMPLSEALARVGLRKMSAKDFEALLTKYDVSLTYVSTMKEGDRLSQSVESQLSDYLADRGLCRLRNEELTGHTPFDDVGRILDELEHPPKEYTERIHAITATSMISHGVDVARLNYMLFFGMPRQTAEYIQSSSRVGRTHVGVVFLCFNPNRARDQSHYHFFRKYHEYLDRLVEPVPINRWSKFSMKRTLPGLFAGYWLNRVFPLRKAKIKGNPYFSDSLRKAILDGVVTEAEAVEFLSRVYGVQENEGLEFGQELPERVAAIFRSALSPKSEMFSDSLTPRPMMSLRDVDEPLAIRPDDNNWDLWRKLQDRKQEG